MSEGKKGEAAALQVRPGGAVAPLTRAHGVYKVSGKRFDLPVASKGWSFERRPGGWVIATSPDGARKRIAIHELRGKLSLSLGGSLWFGEVIQEGRTASGSVVGADSDLVAQFPGKVRKLLVSEGAKVAAGEPLILVEAMKMEFTVKAPFAGAVQRVLVQEGQQLSPGDRFFEIAPLTDGGGESG